MRCGALQVRGVCMRCGALQVRGVCEMRCITSKRGVYEMWWITNKHVELMLRTEFKTRVQSTRVQSTV